MHHFNSRPEVNIKRLKIGPVELGGNLILAPLASITDYPFRMICRGFGADLTVSEMISSQALIRDNRRSIKMASTCRAEHPLSVQISGSDPAVMARAAKMAEELGAAIVDINMGCPQKKIVKTGSGAALMKDLDRAARVMESVVQAVDIPVTVKMRLGWDFDSMNAHLLAKRAEDAGAVLVTVHARTRSQMFSGRARWSLVRAVKETVSIPVIVNGDICCPETFARAMQESCADGAMIGRCALGRPWIFQQIKAADKGAHWSSPAPSERLPVIMDHLRLMEEFYGDPVATWMARKHLAWYTKGMKHAARFRDAVNRAPSLEEARRLLISFFRQADERQAP